MESFVLTSRIIHVLAGSFALISGILAIIFRNKLKFHKPVGKIYFWSMTVIFFTSTFMSLYKNNMFLLCIGFFTYYSCITAYRSLKLKKLHVDQSPSNFDWFIEIVFGLVHIGFVCFAVYLLLYQKTTFGIISLVFGLIGLRGNQTTINRFRKKIIYKNYWLLAHIGGMLGSYIGALTAFLVNNNHVVPLPPIALWLGPTVFLAPLIAYELNKQKKKSFKIDLKMKTLSVIVCLFIGFNGFAQPYSRENGKTRHSFAQTVFGIESQVSLGGSSKMVNENGEVENFNLKPQITPRVYIAGTHFWGHSEFYFSIPLLPIQINQNNGIYYKTIVTDVFGVKIFPWAIKRNKARPFIGATIAAISFKQYKNKNEGMGVNYTTTKVPLHAGVNYCAGKYFIEASATYDYSNQLNYFISPTIQSRICTSQLYFNLTLKRWFETTMSAERSYRSGETKKKFDKLKEEKKLSSWFIGIGPSSAFFTKSSPEIKDIKPYLDKPYSTNVFPEAVAGYYYQPLETHFVTVLRANKTKHEGYGTKHTYLRRAMTFETHTRIFDFHGFVPYLGFCGSYEWLNFKDEGGCSETYSAKTTMVKPGIVFGWDILPDKLQSFTLRTNLRYFPNLKLQGKSGKNINFDQLEFNFIQLVFYPQRLKNIR